MDGNAISFSPQEHSDFSTGYLADALIELTSKRRCLMPCTDEQQSKINSIDDFEKFEIFFLFFDEMNYVSSELQECQFEPHMDPATNTEFLLHESYRKDFYTFRKWIPKKRMNEII
ncbi:hypothetical protein Lal_00008074 [Lupinus albus]|nr:hypothetical protein Lal_00008074 [Lupinus albus]